MPANPTSPITIRETMLSKGWRPEWFNETGTIARISSRVGAPCFEPFFWKHRIFHHDRCLMIRNLLGAEGTLIRFSSALSRDEAFLGNIESNESSERRTAVFPWDRLLPIRFAGHPRSRLDINHHYFHVLDKERGFEWTVGNCALTWVREVSVLLPNEHAT
jgi:hypothetical protein